MYTATGTKSKSQKRKCVGPMLMATRISSGSRDARGLGAGVRHRRGRSLARLAGSGGWRRSEHSPGGREAAVEVPSSVAGTDGDGRPRLPAGFCARRMEVRAARVGLAAGDPGQHMCYRRGGFWSPARGLGWGSTCVT
jgi:hypothetical protein